jgi:hypothetical protein
LFSKEFFESPEAATCQIRCFHARIILPKLKVWLVTGQERQR